MSEALSYVSPVAHRTSGSTAQAAPVVNADAAAGSAATFEEPIVSAGPAARKSPLSRITRLLCAHVYLFGIFSSTRAVFRLLGPAYRAADPGVGYDRRLLAYHAVQSTLLALVFLAFLLFVFLGVPKLIEIENFDAIFGVMSFVVFVKAALINPWIARLFFRDENRLPKFNIPILGRIARAICDAWLPLERQQRSNASYFAGDRPFIGYGTEVNAWTVVIDTSTPAHAIHDLIDRGREPTPLDAEQLYGAVSRGVENLGINDLSKDWRVFIDGRHADEEKRVRGSRYRRPPEDLSADRVAQINKEGRRGRSYMSLTMENAKQDLLATQFLRFQQDGKLIFCEFASYILAPGLRRLYFLDRLFHVNSILYVIFGITLFVAAAVPASLICLGLGLIYYLPHSDSFLASALYPASAGAGIIGNSLDTGSLADVFQYFGQFAWAAYAITVAATAYLAFVIAWRGLRWLLTTLGIALKISKQFGIAFSYRERFASRGELKYYELQEVIRFLKTQEKILLKSIHEQLKEHGIDSSDFKESLVAYINQGVINSGDIRGNVFSSIRSFVFRRPRKSAVKRVKGSTAHA